MVKYSIRVAFSRRELLDEKYFKCEKVRCIQFVRGNLVDYFIRAKGKMLFKLMYIYNDCTLFDIGTTPTTTQHNLKTVVRLDTKMTVYTIPPHHPTIETQLYPLVASD